MKRNYARRLIEHVYMARYHIISHVFGQPLIWMDGFTVRDASHLLREREISVGYDK